LKILFIHEVSYREKVIYEMHEFPELLALRNHEIFFLEFDEKQKFWQKPNSVRFEKVRGRVHPNAAINISRPLQVGVPGLDRLLATITVLPLLKNLLRLNNFDAIVLYAVPTYGLQTMWLARRFNIPVLFRALDVSHKIRSSLWSPAIKWVEKLIYNQVDSLSANNRAMANYCVKLGLRTKQTEVHFPPLDLGHFKTQSRDQDLRGSLGFKAGDRVLVYMGSFFYFSGLLDALQEFAEVSKSAPKLKFLLIGGGEQDSELRKRVERLGLSEKVVFTSFISYQDLPRYLKIADVAVNTLEPTLVANVAFPNKVLQYMAAGLPVVSTRLDGLEQTFGDRAGITWASDPKGVIRAASKLSQLTDSELGQISERQIGVVSEIFSVESAVDRFEETLMALSEEGPK
jgi:glycosyltransferase involved in cell wall biosynthesis